MCTRCFLTIALPLLVLTNVSYSSYAFSPSRCEETVWTPRLSPGPWNPILRYLLSFPTQEECMASLCVPQCGQSTFYNFLTASHQSEDQQPPEQKPTPSSEAENQTLDQNDTVSIPTEPPFGPAGVFHDVSDLLATLGPNAKVLLDSTGELVGVEAPVPESETPSKGDKQAGGLPPVSGRSSLPRDDSAVSCSTAETFYVNRTIIDYFGNNQTIAQRSQIGTYQFIRHGYCVRKGACIGECDLMWVNVVLVIYPPRPGEEVSFSFFKVPGYCRCVVRGSMPKG